MAWIRRRRKFRRGMERLEREEALAMGALAVRSVGGAGAPA
ncbi:MAG: hypothetical protein AAGF11_40700 [Myxococcota bacterium]